jgi:SprT-like family
MTAALPSPAVQKRLPFRPTHEQAVKLYKNINRYVFDNQLTQPEIILKGNLRKSWAFCDWRYYPQKLGRGTRPDTYCKIVLMDKWFCPQWFCNTLAHEMVHQYQWDIERFDSNYQIHTTSGAHGPSFFVWRDHFAKFGLHLKTSHGMRRWLRHQDFRKC